MMQRSSAERCAVRRRIARIATATATARARLDAKLVRWEQLSPAERDRLRAGNPGREGIR
jgi:hypothetical protein